MSRKKVLSMFASARTYPRREGVRECIALPSSPPPMPDVFVYGSVTFDDSDHLDSITLKSTSPRPAGATDAALLLAANKVAVALGIEPLSALPSEPKTWKRKATHIVLEWDEECFWFELTS